MPVDVMAVVIIMAASATLIAVGVLLSVYTKKE